jgi:hypothetical protein
MLINIWQVRLKELSDIRAGSGAGQVRRPPSPSSPALFNGPDTSLISDYVPNSKSNDCNKSVPVIPLFIRRHSTTHQSTVKGLCQTYWG